jgi:hypothetical protein
MRAQAQGRAQREFKESCETMVVSAYGGLRLLKHEIDNGEMLVLPLFSGAPLTRSVNLSLPA